jgi:hypothetical protein
MRSRWRCRARTLARAGRSHQFRKPSVWWLWLIGCLLHVESAVTELVAGKVLASGKDTVLAALWWLGVHAERAGDRGRARALIFVILAFDVSQRLL